MSQEENGSVLETVTETYRSRTDEEMNIIGLLYGIGLVIVLIPLIPFFLLIWLASKVNDLLG